MQMILIAGQAGVGKSTMAKMIAAEAFKKGLTPVLLSFASPLKEEAARKGYGKEVNPQKYRSYCQEIGAARRADDPDYWIYKFDESVKKIQKDEQKAVNDSSKFWERVIIIDDARYPNELAYGKLHEATSIFISARDRDDLDLAAEWRNHESEDLAKRIDNGVAGTILKEFTNIVFSCDGLNAYKETVEEMVPIWCGLTADQYCEDNTCTCDNCMNKALDVPNLQDILENLTDMLFLSDPDIPDPDDEEEDEDDYS